jgi:Rieske Fe-S protein
MEETITTRRKVLIGMTATVGAVGASFAAVPFIASWNPSAKAKAVGGPVRIDVSKMQLAKKSKFHGESNLYLLFVIVKRQLKIFPKSNQS